MAEFLTKKVDTVKDWDLYCHYVAGLVGEGLSRLFAVSGLEDPSFSAAFKLYNSMGLFLQKTNIIRDYFEDIAEVPPRIFYPKEVWSKYVPTVESLKDPAYKNQALLCLNELITNALEHTEDVIDYLSKLKEPSVLRFCGIPQVMAIATLHLCYNNYEVFRRKEVKIRRGMAVKLMFQCDSLTNILGVFLHFVKEFEDDIKQLAPADNSITPHLKMVLASLKGKILGHPAFRNYKK